jgi:hypothetical protein
MLAHWASSFCFSFSSPYMINNIGANTFLIFMAFDILATIFCFIFVKETRGKALEVAAGTEWEVAEKKAVDGDDPSAAEKGDPGIQVRDSDSGQELEVVAVQDTFQSDFLKKGKLW